jgi:hypothetical protein
MTTILISAAVVATMFFKVNRRPEEPLAKIELINIDINPRWVSHTAFERSEFTQNQREAIGILESGNVKMFNDFCSETKLTIEQINSCKEEVKLINI